MTQSVNAITQEIYEIPDCLDDSEAIKAFLSKNIGKKVVVVQGLGFVGAVMSLVCANAISEEYAVIGIDLPNEQSFWKVRSINEGTFPVIADDPKIEIFYQKAMEKGNLMATYDPIAYQFADIIIVDVNLDVFKDSNKKAVLKSFDVNLSNFESAIRSIGSNCQEDVLILVETTVPPGTCNKVVKPIIVEELKRRGLATKNFKLGHSYERVMPGPDYIDSIREFPRVYSGLNKENADDVEIFLKTIIDVSTCSLTRLESTNATEMAKVLENSYRAMNIAFAVEWSRYAEEMGVNLYGIVDAIRVRKTHSNLMYPGIGVGGYCLTKDPLLASWSRKAFFNSDSDLNMSVDSVSTNDQMPVFAFERLIKIFGPLKNLKITVLGVSYRGDVADTRFSPVEVLTNLIKETGSIVNFHDPFVLHWLEQDSDVQQDLSIALEPCPDLIIISTGHSLYKSEKTLQILMTLAPCKIFDTVGILNDEQVKTLMTKHHVSVLGRGDIE